MPHIDPKTLPKNLILIGDQRTEGTGPSVTRRYAGTGEVVRDVKLGSVQDLDAAVGSARAALPIWRALAPSVRRDMMLKAAAILLTRVDHLARLAAIDAGLPVENVGWFVKHAAEWLTYYAGWVDKDAGSCVPAGPNALDYIRHEPYGVIGVISPSNSSVSGMIIAPLLAAGNCAVVKPSEFTSCVTAEFLQVFVDAGMPPGVVNCVPGGADVGEALVRHPGIDKVHFTGSCSAGAHVSATAAACFKPVALELGGKSANIVFPDANLDVASDIAMRAVVRQSGQSCVAGTRVLVHASVAETVLSKTLDKLAAQRVGDPLSADTTFGPVVSAAARDRIMGVIDDARQGGYGRLATGGERVSGALSGGYFVSPTVFADVDNASPLAQEETFGPVISFITFRTDDEAVQLANASRFGLAAYIQTADLRRAHQTAAQLEVGTIWINGAVGLIPGAPFGGVKESGYGRIGGLEGLREFCRPKNIWVGL